MTEIKTCFKTDWFTWSYLLRYAFVITILAVIGLGWFCAWKIFSPKIAELKLVQKENPNMTPVLKSEQTQTEIASLESYKATYELFNGQFSQLLVILGFFGTVFGIVIPAGAYFLQRQNLKDERERLLTDSEKFIKEQIDSAHQELEAYKLDFFYEIGTSYVCQSNTAIMLIDKKEDNPERNYVPIANLFVLGFISVGYFTKARNLEKTAISIKEYLSEVEIIRKKFKKSYEKALQHLRTQRIHVEFGRSVCPEDTAFLIKKNYPELCEKYLDFFKEIFPSEK